MYHSFSKNNPLVRKALYEAYLRKCAYCGDLMQPKNMQIDHILATKAKKVNDTDFNNYIDELMRDGFELDSIENYCPSCASCNLKKNNRNFSVDNLRYFHSEAKDKAEKVLSIINKFQNCQVSFDEFEPEYDCWEKVDFSRQKDIAEAIAGYRLQPCHVCACPRLTQVEDIKKMLEIVDYVIVEGEPGCGKSISVYQAAYDLSAKGYTVYRYINKNAEGVISVPHSNDKQYLIIIDDAQNLIQCSIDPIISQSQKKSKIILVFTKMVDYSHLYSEPIRITNFDAVKIIAQDFKDRKQEILPIVQQYDKFVGDGMLDIPFERRIKNAATQKTPWLFNYTLRGGWNLVNEQFQAVYNHNKCGLLCAIIAVFQILRMDSAIDFMWLQTYIHNLDNELSWTKEDLDYLIKFKLVASFDDVRIVHIWSAKEIVNCFYNVADEKFKRLICRILEDGYVKHLFKVQGLIWLQSVLSSSVLYDLERQVFTESLLDSVFYNLDTIEDDEQRGCIVYFLERIFHMHKEKNGKFYFTKYEQLLSQWISRATSKNVYEYSQLLNTLNNERNDSLKSFVSKIDFNSLLRSFDNCSVEDLYVWCKLLNRLALAYDVQSIKWFGKLIIEPLTKKNKLVDVNNVAEFYTSLSELYYINPDLISDLLTVNIDKFQNLWMSKPKDAINTLDFHFLAYICGVPFLSLNNKPTLKQRSFSKAFVDNLPVKEIANYISYSLPRDWNRIFDIGRLLYRENKRKFSKIVNCINLDALCKTTYSFWKHTDGELHLLFRFIVAGDYVIAQKFFEINKNFVEELGVVYIEALPVQAIEMFKKGSKLRLFENHWNTISLNALKALHIFSADDYKSILNSEVKQIVNRINELCILDFGKKEKTLYEILTYIKESHPNILVKIVPLLDYNKIKKEKLSMLKDSRFNRRCKKIFNEMIDLLIDYSDEKSKCELQSLKSLKLDIIAN